MPLDIITIPCLTDNYAFLAHDPISGATALIDVPEAAPILEVLTERNWSLSEIWITHHHDDHVQGLSEVLAHHNATVTGAAADVHRLPPLDRRLGEGDRFVFGSSNVEVFDVPGHTTGHIAFYIPDSHVVFTADSLMAMGCGRLFEGTAEQMWDSLGKLMALPPETQICSGHEYTASNAEFALTVDPENSALISRIQEIKAARATGKPTVPSTLSQELATNPFLRAADPKIRTRLGLADAPDAEVFAKIRSLKDCF